MRIALVHEDTHAPRGATTLSGMLARPVEALAEDLAGLGHVVQHVRMRHPSLRSLIDPVHDVLPASSGATVHRLDTAPGRELSVLRAASPDAVLAIGAGAGRLVEEIIPALRVRWVWSPGAEGCLDARGEPHWVPTTAARLVLSSRAERDAFARAGVPRSLCDLAPWHLGATAYGPRSAADEPRVVRTALTAADPGGEGVADVVRALALLPGLRVVVAVDPATGRHPEVLHRWVRLARGLDVSDRVRLVRVTSAGGMRTLLPGAGMLVSVPRVGAQRELIAAAMWSGVPVVASDLDDVREMVETGCSGLVLPPGDGRRLARALEVVRRDASSRGQWARAARRRAQDLFAPSITSLAVAQSLATPSSPGSVGHRTVGVAGSRDVFGDAATG